MAKIKIKQDKLTKRQIFFSTDKVKKGKVKEVFCAINNMLPDLFTKPLQGCTSRKIFNTIINLPNTKTTDDAHRSVL